MKQILVTGGAGYIGSHTCLKLLEQGYGVTVIDNLSNSSVESLKRVKELSHKSIAFHEADLCDKAAIRQIFSANDFDAVIHFAGLKAVGESVDQPLKYYTNNIGSTLVLCDAMESFGVRNLVFSSSATVYGRTDIFPTPETEPIGATNPYGRTKAMIEDILRDLANAKKGWRISILRYFNPIGAHPSGKIGEDPNGIPNNLLPFITKVAIGEQPSLRVFGNDYDTPDGTGIRDYIHVLDLAEGHIAAINHMPAENTAEAYNLGTGKGSSVLEVVKAFEQATGITIPLNISPRRPGDVSRSYADASKAKVHLEWQASLSLEQACADSWRWQSSNPEGYAHKAG